jgi:hypothetical protein
MDFRATKFESKNLLDEGVNHTTSNYNLICNINHFADKLQFIDNFGPSQNGQYRFYWFLDKTTKILNLFFHQ